MAKDVSQMVHIAGSLREAPLRNAGQTRSQRKKIKTVHIPAALDARFKDLKDMGIVNQSFSSYIVDALSAKIKRDEDA